VFGTLVKKVYCSLLAAPSAIEVLKYKEKITKVLVYLQVFHVQSGSPALMLDLLVRFLLSSKDQALLSCEGQ